MPPKLVPRVSLARQPALIGRPRCRGRRRPDKTQASFASAAATEEEVRRHGHSTGASHGRVLVPGFVDEAIFGDPRHHGAQLLADLFDLVLCGTAAQRLEAGLSGVVFEHPFTLGIAGLYI